MRTSSTYRRVIVSSRAWNSFSVRWYMMSCRCFFIRGHTKSMKEKPRESMGAAHIV